MRGELLMNSAFIIFIIIHTLFIKRNMIKNSFDKTMSISAIIISIVILSSLNCNMMSLFDLGHFLYCGMYLPLISIFSSNEKLLLLNCIMLSTVIISRYYYQGCIMSKTQKNKGVFVNINKKFKLNWWYIYPILLIISVYRYLCLTK